MVRHGARIYEKQDIRPSMRKKDKPRCNRCGRLMKRVGRHCSACSNIVQRRLDALKRQDRRKNVITKKAV